MVPEFKNLLFSICHLSEVCNKDKKFKLQLVLIPYNILLLEKRRTVLKLRFWGYDCDNSNFWFMYKTKNVSKTNFALLSKKQYDWLNKKNFYL